MRRIGLLALAVVSALALTGCSGTDAKRAQELLSQSDHALQGLKSYRFAGRIWIESDAADFSLVMRGGGNTARGGPSFLIMRSDDLPGFPEVTLVQQGHMTWVRAGGAWQRTEALAGQPTGLQQFDFSPYVKDVTVDEDAMVDGEPAVKMTGVLDTTSMVEGVFASLGGASGTAGLPFDQLANSFEDTRVVLYLSEATHLPVRTLVDMSVDAEGQKVKIHLDFALEPAKRRVRIPVPTA
jgi:hypothetical protein